MPIRDLQRSAAGVLLRAQVTLACLTCCLLLTVGCSGGASSSLVVARDLNPDEVAARAMALYDGDSNGELSAAELEKSPALKSVIARLDADKNGKLSAAEIVARYKVYQQQSDLMAGTMQLVRAKQPVVNATVVCKSAPFVVDPPMTFKGTTDAAGQIEFDPSDYGVSGMPVGLYELEVSGPTQGVAGVELAEDTAGRGIVVSL